MKDRLRTRLVRALQQSLQFWTIIAATPKDEVEADVSAKMIEKRLRSSQSTTTCRLKLPPNFCAARASGSQVLFAASV